MLSRLEKPFSPFGPVSSRMECTPTLHEPGQSLFPLTLAPILSHRALLYPQTLTLAASALVPMSSLLPSTGLTTLSTPLVPCFL